MTPDQALDARLRAWADDALPLPPALSARTLAAARAELEGRGTRGGRVRSVVLATAVSSAVAVYVAWAVEFLGALTRS